MNWKLKVPKSSKGNILIALPPRGLADYIVWHAREKYKVEFYFPRVGPHVTIVNSRFDGHAAGFNAKNFKGRKIKIDLNWEKIRVNRSRLGFLGIYADVDSEEIFDIRAYCGIIKPRKNYRPHFTVATTKNKIVPYFGQIVEIK